MSFLHLSLLAGLGAISVPLMLHLFGQRQPQLLDFPALRFVRETRQEQSTSWQLRHFLLLLLRILLLAALALAVARPRVHSSVLNSIFSLSAVGVCALLASVVAAAAFAGKRPRSIVLSCLVVALALWAITALWTFQSLSASPPVPKADNTAPVAAALIVDNGPTMAYRSDNAERLDRAKEHATWVLDKLPQESKVGVLLGAPISSLGLDPSTAKTQVQLLEHRGAHVDLLSRLNTALDLVLKSELERKEIYIVTDLMAPSWTSAQPGLKELLDEHEGEVLVQIIDVGSEDQANWSLGDPKLSLDSVAVGGDVAFEILVRRPDSQVNNASVTVELLQESIDPRLPIIRNGDLQVPPASVVDRRVVDLTKTPSAVVKLQASDLAEGVHHFTLRIDKSDPLDIDNQRFVSIPARPAQPTLILSDDVELGTEVLQYIVDPFGESQSGLVQQIRYSQLNQTPLDRYALAWLHDPPPMSSTNVEKLQKFVNQGGCLLIVLGPSLGDVDNIASNPLAKLLPGQIQGVAERNRVTTTAFPTPVALSHPLFQDWGEDVTNQVWNRFTVFKNWNFTSLSEGVQTVMEMSEDESPLILSEAIGQGQIITFTTPIPSIERRNNPLWNNFWSIDNPYEAFSLLRGALSSLYGATQENLNYQVSVPISLRNDETVWPSRYELYLPNAKTRRVQSTEGQLDIGSMEQVGTYRLRGLRGAPASRGFSINAPAADTELRRVDLETLNEQIGSEHFRIARNRSEVESSVGQARFGRELYPLLMVFVAGLFVAEQAMSNLFYKIKFR